MTDFDYLTTDGHERRVMPATATFLSHPPTGRKVRYVTHRTMMSRPSMSTTERPLATTNRAAVLNQLPAPKVRALSQSILRATVWHRVVSRGTPMAVRLGEHHASGAT